MSNHTTASTSNMNQTSKFAFRACLFLFRFVLLVNILSAQRTVKVSIPGSAFTTVRGRDAVTVQDLADGRQFQGRGFTFFRANLRAPSGNTVIPKIKRLTIRYRSNADAGPPLRSVALLQGTSSAFELETYLRGDFTKVERKNVNTWEWADPVITINSNSVLRLGVAFSIPIDGPGDPRGFEFVLVSVDIEFPTKTLISVDKKVTIQGQHQNSTRPRPTSNASAEGVLYGVSSGNDLLWYKHTGRTNGTPQWAKLQGNIVGQGWNEFKKVFAGGDGVIYVIKENGDLLWYKHTGCNNGTAEWATPQGSVVGQGWNNAKEVFAGDGGTIYAIKENGDLLWYKHIGRNNGTPQWAEPQGSVVGQGWHGFKKVFAGGDGVIYAIATNGDLLWYKHTGQSDGTPHWASPQGSVVGQGWNNAKDVFSDGDGVIYAIKENGDLLWYKHTGRNDGTAKWAEPQGSVVGQGWNDFKEVFTH